jgi:GAF domain-containing protein
MRNALIHSRQANNDLKSLLSETIAAAVKVANADMGNIQLLENGMLKLVAHVGFDQPFLEYFAVVLFDSDSACGVGLRTGTRVIVECVATSPVFRDHSRGVLLSAGVRAVQSTPLIGRKGDAIGMLSTHYREPRVFGERECALIDGLAKLISSLIETEVSFGAAQQTGQ